MEHNLGKLIWNQSSTLKEMGKRIFFHMWGALFVCFFFGLFVRIFIQELLNATPARNWYYLIGSAIVMVVCIFAIFVMVRNTLENCKKQSVFIYERGLIYMEGKAVTQISFGDIKGIQDMLQVMDDGEVTSTARIFTIVRHDDTRRLFNQHDVPSYDACFTQLRQAFNAFFIQDTEGVDLLHKPIWMGIEIAFDGERFHMYGNDRWLVIPPQDIAKASAYVGKSNTRIDIHGKVHPSDIPELLTTLSSAELYNPDLLYWRITQAHTFYK